MGNFCGESLENWPVRRREIKLQTYSEIRILTMGSD